MGVSTAAVIGFLGTGAGVATTAAVAGSAAYAASESSKQQKAGRAAATDQAKRSEQLQNQLYARQDTAESDANRNKVRDEARKRQGALAAGAQGRRSTILTSPLGASAATGAEQQKTALGA